MGTEARLEETDRAAWSALKEWLAKDQEGQALLSQLLANPEAGARALVDRLRGADVPALAATWLSGGSIGKLVTIARAERVSIAEGQTDLAGSRETKSPSADLAPPVPRQLPVAVRHFAGRAAGLELL